MADQIRPTKKQKELLTFIDDFIAAHGYSPSYREIMAGCGYTSVATVALHVNNLIRRGHLVKRDHSARSLEVVKSHSQAQKALPVKQLKVAEEKWLVDKVEYFFLEAESLPTLTSTDLDKLIVLVGALKVLGLDGASTAFSKRLAVLRRSAKDNKYVV